MNIKVQNLTAGYKKGFKLKDISLNISSGSFTGLIGPNGSGKSTLLKVMAGIIKPLKGKIVAGSLNMMDMKVKERSRIISYLPPAPPVSFPFTVFEMVLMGRNPYQRKFVSESRRDKEEALKAMELVGITEFKERFISDMSTGERQKVMLARIICQNPRIMLMDEPGSHLDIHHLGEIFKLLKEINSRGVTIIAALHDINLVSAHCSSAVALKRGKMFSQKDRTRKLINKESLEKLYGEGVKVQQIGQRKYVLP